MPEEQNINFSQCTEGIKEIRENLGQRITPEDIIEYISNKYGVPRGVVTALAYLVYEQTKEQDKNV